MHDYRLQVGSPAIDAGLDMSSVATTFRTAFGTSLLTDRAGTPRPNGVWDIGAYRTLSLQESHVHSCSRPCQRPQPAHEPPQPLDHGIRAERTIRDAYQHGDGSANAEPGMVATRCSRIRRSQSVIGSMREWTRTR